MPSSTHAPTGALDLDQVTHAAAHDLRGPLRRLRTWLEMLLETHEDLDPGIAGELERIDGFAENAQRVVEDLVRFTLAFGARACPTRVSTEDLLGRVLRDAVHDDREASITVAELPEVRCDAKMLTTVFEELVSNALKFRAAGEPAVLRIDCQTLPEQGRCRIAFADQGLGFDPRHTERVFEPFGRLCSKKDYPGSGLGLSLARALLSHNDGTLEAEARPDAGATFFLELPLA